MEQSTKLIEQNNWAALWKSMDCGNNVSVASSGDEPHHGMK
jgi:hypothetical protein